MVEIQEGIGFGIKKTRVSFVFKNKQSWDDFVNSGWGGLVYRRPQLQKMALLALPTKVQFLSRLAYGCIN